MTDVDLSFPHLDDPEVFLESLKYTESETGFSSVLVEKDYYCSLVLRYFYSNHSNLVFKGGTCLGKVYTDFYRLSEDLDFVIPLEPSAGRSQRRKAIAVIKESFSGIPSVVTGMEIEGDLTGHNESKQYIGYVAYPSSLFKDKKDTIKIEIGLRESLLLPPERKTTRTIAVNPFTGKKLVDPFDSLVISRSEAFAEKVRAALSRREPAIRDFFDLLYARDKLAFDFTDKNFLDLVRKKLAVPGNFPVDVSADRKNELEKQVETQLRSVLRKDDYTFFNLDMAFGMIESIAEYLL